MLNINSNPENANILCWRGNKVFKGIKLDRKIAEYGGIKEVLHLGTGSQHGFPFGFSVGCIHYKRGYSGCIEYTRKY